MSDNWHWWEVVGGRKAPGSFDQRHISDPGFGQGSCYWLLASSSERWGACINTRCAIVNCYKPASPVGALHACFGSLCEFFTS